MKPRILFVVANLNMGGAEKSTINIARSLAKDNYRVSIFLLKDEGVLRSELSDSVNIYFGSDGPIRYKFFTVLWKLFRVIKEHDIIIGALELLPTYLSYTLAKLLRKKAIGWVHTDLTLYLSDKNMFDNLLARLFYSLSNNIVFVSEGAKSSLYKSSFKHKPSNWSVIPNSIDVKYYENSIHRESRNRHNLIWYGRYEKVKRLDLLLDVMSILVNRDIRYNLLLIGYGPCEVELREKISNLKLENNVFMLEKQNTLCHFLDKSDVFILTSKYEGFGNVIVESMARGVPVISANCPHGPKEILRNGEFGILVDSDDALDFSLKVIELCSNQEIYNELSKKSLSRAYEYHPDSIRSYWIDYLNKV